MNLLTFDIEPWFLSYDPQYVPLGQWSSLPARIEEIIPALLQFLDQQQTKGTFYIMGWVAERFPEAVHAIAKAGHEIGYHSYYHTPPENQSQKAFEEDLENGLHLLASITGTAVTHYRAPRFSLGFHTGWVIPILLKHGITTSSSVMGGRRQADRQIPHTPFIFDYQGHQLVEFPLNRQNTMGFQWVYTGSGYLRLLPMTILQHLYAKNTYNMAYFHPRDFDTNAARTPLLPWYRNLMSNLGNNTTIPKLTQLIQHHHFQTIGQAASEISIHQLPILKTKDNR